MEVKSQRKLRLNFYHSYPLLAQTYDAEERARQYAKENGARQIDESMLPKPSTVWEDIQNTIDIHGSTKKAIEFYATEAQRGVIYKGVPAGKRAGGLTVAQDLARKFGMSFDQALLEPGGFTKNVVNKLSKEELKLARLDVQGTDNEDPLWKLFG